MWRTRKNPITKVIFLNKYTGWVWNDDLFLKLCSFEMIEELFEIWDKLNWITIKWNGTTRNPSPSI